MEELTLKFDKRGGHDGLFGAWLIEHGDKTLVVVDQCLYGQFCDDYDFKSTEAEAVAKICFDALKKAF